MKKTLIALAVLATSGAAMAQSTFTLYGVADANVTREKGGTNSVNKLDSGGLNGSRWGLRGAEDLGGGLKGVFALESGFAIDGGTSAQGGRLFGRQAFVGLEGNFGSFRLGRQYTPIGNVADVFGTKTLDVNTVLKTLAAVTAYRTDNAITYKTPSMSGFTVEAQYSFQYDGAETNTGTSPKLGRHFGVNAMYANGPVTFGLGYIGIEDTTSATAGQQKANEILAVAGYDLGVAKIMGQFSQTDFDTPNNMKVYSLNAAFPFGAATITPGVSLAQDVLPGTMGNGLEDATLFTLQATYDLSKRTALYSHLTVVSNDDNTAVGFNTPTAGKGSNAFQVGVRHRF